MFVHLTFYLSTMANVKTKREKKKTIFFQKFYCLLSCTNSIVYFSLGPLSSLSIIPSISPSFSIPPRSPPPFSSSSSATVVVVVVLLLVVLVAVVVGMLLHLHPPPRLLPIYRANSLYAVQQHRGDSYFVGSGFIDATDTFLAATFTSFFFLISNVYLCLQLQLGFSNV